MGGLKESTKPAEDYIMAGIDNGRRIFIFCNHHGKHRKVSVLLRNWIAVFGGVFS